MAGFSRDKVTMVCTCRSEYGADDCVPQRCHSLLLGDDRLVRQLVVTLGCLDEFTPEVKHPSVANLQRSSVNITQTNAIESECIETCQDLDVIYWVASSCNIISFFKQLHNIFRIFLLVNITSKNYTSYSTE